MSLLPLVDYLFNFCRVSDFSDRGIVPFFSVFLFVSVNSNMTNNIRCKKERKLTREVKKRKKDKKPEK